MNYTVAIIVLSCLALFLIITNVVGAVMLFKAINMKNFYKDMYESRVEEMKYRASKPQYLDAIKIVKTIVEAAQNTLAHIDDDIEDKSYYSGRKDMAEDLFHALLNDKNDTDKTK